MNSWSRILAEVKNRVTPQNFATWFRPTYLHSREDGSLNIVVPNKPFRDWLVEEFSGILEEAIEAASQAEGVKLRVTFVPAQAIGADEEAPESATAGVVESGAWDGHAPQLNPRYTFESFVVGSSNQFAHAAARRVSEAPSTGYNPLFIYGGVGLGKTHLMHAVGHAILQSGRNLRLTYISCERFMNELIRAIRTERQLDFRSRYRQCDILLMDDIQFIQGKERTQEEFFHTFNELYENGRQIVITSDRPPAEIPTIEERLKSRFEWGLRADIQPPELETKIAILQKKAEAERINLPQDVSLYIASKVKSNIRELEGSLIRLIAKSSLTGRPLSLDLSKEALSDITGTEDRPVTLNQVMRHVAEFYELKASDLKSRNNQKAITFPRQVAMWLAKKKTQASFPEIGREFGGKHHTTVMHSVSKIENLRRSDPELDKLLASLAESL